MKKCERGALQMSRSELIKLLMCIGSEASENLPEIVEPFSKYGKSIGTMIKAVKDGIDNYNKSKTEQLVSDVKDEIKEMLNQTTRPNYMDCVMYSCKKGYILTEEQQDDLACILAHEFESDDVESLFVIGSFIGDYMGGHIEVDSEDDCSIGCDYLCLNFFVEEDEYPYNEDAIRQFMNAINTLLGVDAFDYYVVDGQMESREDNW